MAAPILPLIAEPRIVLGVIAAQGSARFNQIFMYLERESPSTNVAGPLWTATEIKEIPIAFQHFLLQTTWGLSRNIPAWPYSMVTRVHVLCVVSLKIIQLGFMIPVLFSIPSTVVKMAMLTTALV